MAGLEQNWCMCKEIKSVARDCKATCSICGGKDAYGTSSDRPEEMRKELKWVTQESCSSLPTTESI